MPRKKFSKEAFRRLTKSGLTEIFREPRLFFFTMIFPLLFLGLFGFMSLMMPPDASSGLTFFQFEFPGILVFSLMSVGILGTAIPIIEMRQKGTLRLFQVTPLSTSTFILSSITIRLILSLGQIVLFLVLGGVFRYVSISTILPVFLISLLGIIVMITLGFFLSGLFKHVEIASGLLSGLMAPVLMISGVLLPLSIMPKVMRTVAEFIPFAYLADAIRQVMFHVREFFPIEVELLILAAFAVVCYGLARWSFHWGD